MQKESKKSKRIFGTMVHVLGKQREKIMLGTSCQVIAPQGCREHLVQKTSYRSLLLCNSLVWVLVVTVQGWGNISSSWEYLFLDMNQPLLALGCQVWPRNLHLVPVGPLVLCKFLSHGH